jgi:hypothetical protein
MHSINRAFDGFVETIKAVKVVQTNRFELINNMDGEEPTEIYIKKVLAGKIDLVRTQLIDAMEAVGYDVVEEVPNIIGRQSAKGWGTGSANVLDVARVLTVRLKSVSENSTAVTFDYLIRHSFMLRGDKKVVRQEAKTIAAISKTQAIEKLCSVCETESTDDSKFCRKCGAPLTSEQAELEVLRMMAETRAGKASVIISSFFTPISAMVMLVLFLLNNAGLMKEKVFTVFMIFAGLGLIAGIVLNFLGWYRLKLALDQPETPPPHVPRYSPETIETAEVKELPPRRAQASVTEGTTNLLDDELINRREKEKVPVSNRRVTNELD